MAWLLSAYKTFIASLQDKAALYGNAKTLQKKGSGHGCSPSFKHLVSAYYRDDTSTNSTRFGFLIASKRIDGELCD